MGTDWKDRLKEIGKELMQDSSDKKKTLKEVKTKVPEKKPIMSLEVFMEELLSKGSSDKKDAVKVVKLLKENGADLIDCSSGGVVRGQKIVIEKNYQVPFAAQIKREANILTGAVGLITDPMQAEKILQAGKADLIFLGREMLRNPYFALMEADKLEDEIRWPRQDKRGKL